MGVDQLSVGGGSYDRLSDIDWSAGEDAVASGNQMQVGEEVLQDGETIEIKKAKLSANAGQPAASSVTLDLVTYDGSGGYTSQTEIFAGDGSTVYESDGDPLASYTNNTGSNQSVGIIVNNQNASSQDVYGEVKGVVN